MKTGPKFKVARRLGERIFPKTQTPKFTISGTERKSKSGKRPRNASEFGRQLIEKQKARLTYGVSERQFRNYVRALKTEAGADKSTLLFQALERRLDNAIFRLGLAASRAAGRQLVSHGHIMVNGAKTRIPSRALHIGDKISIRVGSREKTNFQNLEEKTEKVALPAWLEWDIKDLVGTVKALPKPGQAELNINFASILEFYSR